MNDTSISQRSSSSQLGLVTGWSLSALVTLLAVLSWGHTYSWKLGSLSTYQIFPLLGLIGFSLMWAHYMIGLTKRLAFPDANIKSYFQWTGYAVLLAIVLHPGLLIYQRFRDGYGLPPKSYETYVAPGLGWVTLLGSISFLIFIAFEFHRVFGQKSWWKYVLYAGDAAMVAIFYHGLRLGDQTQTGWYHYVWIIYGVSLIGVLLYNYVGKLTTLPGARKV